MLSWLRQKRRSYKYSNLDRARIELGTLWSEGRDLTNCANHARPTMLRMNETGLYAWVGELTMGKEPGLYASQGGGGGALLQGVEKRETK